MERVCPAIVVSAAILAIGAPVASAAAGPALAVDAGADRHAISPDIYGLNYADPGLAAELGLPVDRWGGNTTDTYNWQLHSSNTGNDYFFENVSDCWDAAHSWCGGGTTNPATVSGYRDFIDKDRT